MAISTNPKPTIYRNLYDNTSPGADRMVLISTNPASLSYSHICVNTEAAGEINASEGARRWANVIK